MSLINVKVNNKDVEIEQGSTILEACRKVGVEIPTLCYLKLQDHKTVNCPGSCRVCLVEVEGRRNLAPSCSTPATPGMSIKSHSAKAIQGRKTAVELLLSDHPNDCLACGKNTQCELQNLSAEMGIRKLQYTGELSQVPVDTSSVSIRRDMTKCIMCRRCETVCSQIQSVNALTAVERGFDAVISTALNLPLAETNCTNCGQCVNVCPVGALLEVDNTADVWKALGNSEKVVVVNTAPSVRVALGEEFGIPAGTSVTGKMAAALRALGFAKVFDTDFAADLTIMEEAAELVNRVTTGGKLPMFTSCCPGWITFAEKEFGPEFLPHLSSCKSPMGMQGAMTKTYLAEKMNVKPENMVNVAIMPCIAKKYEANREEMGRDGSLDTDIVLSTRELARMIKEAGIDFASLEDENFDNPLGESTGASVIFGATGGVMEAALRTAYEWVTKEQLENVEFHATRGFEGVKEATVDLAGTKINIAIASGLANARKLVDAVLAGTANYHFIEIMACPGGCIDGGGQPYIAGNNDTLAKRMKAIYGEDKDKTIRKSHENPSIIKIYDEYLEKPNSHKSHELLHTHYTKR